jgi:hypothetical protein
MSVFLRGVGSADIAVGPINAAPMAALPSLRPNSRRFMYGVRGVEPIIRPGGNRPNRKNRKSDRRRPPTADPRPQTPKILLASLPGAPMVNNCLNPVSAAVY